MKRILLSLLISAPLCAMKPEQKLQHKDIQRVKTQMNVTTGFGAAVTLYSALKPMEAGIIIAQPTLWPIVAPAVVIYGGSLVLTEIYNRGYIKEENNK